MRGHDVPPGWTGAPGTIPDARGARSSAPAFKRVTKGAARYATAMTAAAAATIARTIMMIVSTIMVA